MIHMLFSTVTPSFRALQISHEDLSTRCQACFAGGMGVMLFVLVWFLFAPRPATAQGEDKQYHQRGRIWETLYGNAFIGDPGAWDYLSFDPKGMFPGFKGYIHPCCNEENAISTFVNANMHNFRSGIIMAARNVLVPGVPPSFNPVPEDYEFFANGTSGSRGLVSPTPVVNLVANYMENEGFNPLLPEEMTSAVLPTNLGITVTRRTYQWSYPGYRDFIIYDYVLKNTGDIVSVQTSQVVPNTGDFQQTLEDVQIAFHSAISTDTKSTINFTGEQLVPVAAGGFGWQPPYTDFYYMSQDRTLFASYDYNGGREPPPNWSWQVKPDQIWEQRFGPELMSPAAFGWLLLDAPPAEGGTRNTASPDVLRIDTHKGGQFAGRDLDLEFFKAGDRSAQEYYEFVTTPDLQEQIGNTGNRHNIYTFTYGPYDLAPGDSLRFVLAEIAGVLDYEAVNTGDPEGHFPDSTLADLERNAELARLAVSWGMGATVDGMALAADAPEPPPAPDVDAVNASQGTEEAAIAVTWGTIAEETSITDGSGSVFYDGLSDLDGYRVFRSRDFQYVSENEDPVLRGADWDLIVDIPKAEFSQWFDTDLGRYSFVDEDVDFGRRYSYYVSAYNSDPGTWTSANGTVVNNLPELASADVEWYAPDDETRLNRTPPTSAAAGPVNTLDIYVVPNPYVFNDAQRSFGIDDPFRMEFRNLPEEATIRIYTVSGDLVRTLDHGPDERGNLSGAAVWDQKTDSGLLVAPGLYIYHVESEAEDVDGSVTGKLMIIR